MDATIITHPAVDCNATYQALESAAQGKDLAGIEIYVGKQFCCCCLLHFYNEKTCKCELKKKKIKHKRISG